MPEAALQILGLVFLQLRQNCHRRYDVGKLKIKCSIFSIFGKNWSETSDAYRRPDGGRRIFLHAIYTKLSSARRRRASTKMFSIFGLNRSNAHRMAEAAKKYRSIFWTRLSLGGRGGSSSSWILQASRFSTTKDRCSAGMPRRDQL